MLGKKLSNSPNSYEKVAEKMNAKYFDLDKWEELSQYYPREEMWKINEEFLSRQIESGKDIYLSSNPFQYMGDGSSFANEIQYLVDNGFEFIETTGGLWHAVR